MSNAPQEIIDLVATFARNQRSYMAANYNEAQVRAEFIDPLLNALVCDGYNMRGYAPQYREVLSEAALGGSQGDIAGAGPRLFRGLSRRCKRYPVP